MKIGDFEQAVLENNSTRFLKLLDGLYSNYPQQVRMVINSPYNENNDTFLHWAKHQYLMNVVYEKCHFLNPPGLSNWFIEQEAKGKIYDNTPDAAHLKDFYPAMKNNYKIIIEKLLAIGVNSELTNTQGRNADQFAKFMAQTESETLINKTTHDETKRKVLKATVSHALAVTTLPSWRIAPQEERPRQRIKVEPYRVNDISKYPDLIDPNRLSGSYQKVQNKNEYREEEYRMLAREQTLTEPLITEFERVTINSAYTDSSQNLPDSLQSLTDAPTTNINANPRQTERLFENQGRYK